MYTLCIPYFTYYLNFIYYLSFIILTTHSIFHPINNDSSHIVISLTPDSVIIGSFFSFLLGPIGISSNLHLHHDSVLFAWPPIATWYCPGLLG